MGGTFVVDASVVVDFLAPPRSDDADRVLKGLGWADPLTLMAPDLIFLEAANALRKLAGRRVITGPAADRAVGALDRLPLAAIPCTSIMASAWSLRGSVTIYDAAYLVLARDLGVPYVTADKRAATAGSKAGVRAWHVSDPELGRLLESLGPRKTGPGEIR